MEKKVTFDELIAKIPNKYELAIVVGKRVRDLGLQNTINAKTGKKEITIQRCFREIRDGHIGVGDVNLINAEKLEREAIEKLGDLSEES